MALASRQAGRGATVGTQHHRGTSRPGRIIARAVAQEQQQSETSPSAAAEPRSRRGLLGIAAISALSAAAAAAAPRAARAADPYLLSTGGKGLLAEEEAKLIALRKELEGEVRRELEAERQALEKEARASLEQGNKLCATPYGIDIVGITEFVALVGALVGGITARQRKAELERLNEQLRKVNMSLRQQARAGMVYAPGLTYVPPTPGSNGNGNGATATLAPPVAPAAPAAATAVAAAPVAVITAPPKPAALSGAAAAPAPDRTLLSMDEDEMTADQIACRDSLRQGKRLLKEKNGAAAMVRFEKALMLSKALEDKVQERRAMRGLAAAARLQGQFKAAIKHLERVLEISKEMSEFTGDADAYGTIADCYTELGDFEAAAANYDKYIKVMNTDGPV